MRTAPQLPQTSRHCGGAFGPHHEFRQQAFSLGPDLPQEWRQSAGLVKPVFFYRLVDHLPVAAEMV
ncbi:hypothetical protein AVEN_52324-1, partial [Araneus ventricosus]